MERTRMLRVSQLVVAFAALMVVGGTLAGVVRPESFSRTSVWGAICLLWMVFVFGIQVRPGAAPHKRPWRDQGRMVLWGIGLMCLLGSASLWLLASYG